MPYVRTNRTPSAAETDQWASAHLARRGLRRGRKYRAGVGLINDPRADAARAALGDVAARLDAVTRTDARIGSKATTRSVANPDHALHAALHACDRLLGRRRR